MVESDLSEAIKLCLDNWTAMKLAIDMGWGEESHKIALEEEIKNYIFGYQVTVDDIAAFLDEVMEQRFSVILDDGSSNEIAFILNTVYEESLKGSQEQLNKLRQLHTFDIDLSKKFKQQEIIPSIENLSIDPPNLVPLVDEEGFETVVSKKNKRNK
jgi:Pre-rRNA-processing protein TSR2